MAPRKKKTQSQTTEKEAPSLFSLWEQLESAAFHSGGDDISRIVSENAESFKNLSDSYGNNVWHICSKLSFFDSHTSRNLSEDIPGRQFEKNIFGDSAVAIAVRNGNSVILEYMFRDVNKKQLESCTSEIREILTDSNIKFDIKQSILRDIKEMKADVPLTGTLDGLAESIQTGRNAFNYPDVQGYGEFIKTLAASGDDPSRIVSITTSYRKEEFLKFNSDLQKQMLDVIKPKNPRRKAKAKAI